MSSGEGLDNDEFMKVWNELSKAEKYASSLEEGLNKMHAELDEILELASKRSTEVAPEDTSRNDK